MIKLKECSFCGSDNVSLVDHNKWNRIVECGGCYARSSAFITDSKADESWSSVTPNAKIQKLIAEYEMYAEEYESNILRKYLSDLKELIGDSND